MKKLTIKITLCAILFLVVSLVTPGCAMFKQPVKDGNAPAKKDSPVTEKPTAEENRILAGLLPEKEGYTWYYSGFAEYGHRMTLKTIENKDGIYTYNVGGQVDDPSGGEAQDRDYSLAITYTIQNGALTQVKKETIMLDSEFDRIELIRTPLEQGSRWVQKVTEPGGNEVTLECTIEDIKKVDGVNVYTVVYRQQGSDYYEKREIKEGVGVLSFEKLLVLKDQSFPAGYFLNEEATGYK